MTRAESALATAKRLAEVAAEEKRLGKVIQDELFWCEDGGENGRWVSDTEWVGMTHLALFLRAYKNRLHDPYGDPLEPEDEYAAMMACERCSVAYQAIQDRKAVRRRRGALRAAIVRIGTLALEETTP